MQSTNATRPAGSGGTGLRIVEVQKAKERIRARCRQDT